VGGGHFIKSPKPVFLSRIIFCYRNFSLYIREYPKSILPINRIDNDDKSMSKM